MRMNICPSLFRQVLIYAHLSALHVASAFSTLNVCVQVWKINYLSYNSKESKLLGYMQLCMNFWIINEKPFLWCTRFLFCFCFQNATVQTAFMVIKVSFCSLGGEETENFWGKWYGDGNWRPLSEIPRRRGKGTPRRETETKILMH